MSCMSQLAHTAIYYWNNKKKLASESGFARVERPRKVAIVHPIQQSLDYPVFMCTYLLLAKIFYDA